MVLIGLLGTKGSGKSTGANYLVSKFGFIEKSFADCLKKICQELFLFSDDQLYGTQEQKETPDPRWFNCSPRSAMQFIGTDLLRNQMEQIMPGIGKNIFTHHFRIWYHEQIKNNPDINVVISDVRFQNEVDFIHELGGIVIKIHRPDIESSDNHQSEKENLTICNYDYHIENNKTVCDFKKELGNIINNYMDSYNQ